MIKVAVHKEGKTLHQKLLEFGTNGIQRSVLYNYDTGKLVGTKRLHDTELEHDSARLKDSSSPS